MNRREFLRNGVLGAAPLAAWMFQAPVLGAAGPQARGTAGQPTAAGGDSLIAYFARTGPELLKPAKGILRHPSISPTLPGAAYSTELWDWDTYWTFRGLVQLARSLGDSDLLRRTCLHAQGSLLNFFDHQSNEGRIPIMISEANPDPFDGLNTEMNQAKPVFGQLALLIADELDDVQWLRPQFDHMLHFYDSWVARNQSSTGLLVWSNDVAIGVDNDPTTYCRPSFSSANLLLNCLYYQDLLAAAELAGRLNRLEDQAMLSRRGRDLGAGIQKYCWDPRDHFYGSSTFSVE